MKTGRPRELSSYPCTEPGCRQFVTVNDYKHALRRCRDCRVARPLERQPRVKVEKVRQHSTAESVWQGAAREDFTAIMTAHFALLRPGIGYFNARDSKERAAGSKRSLRSVPI